MNIKSIDRALFRKALRGAAKQLEKNKEEVNSLNVFPVPDGDTGTNMSLTMNSAVKEALGVEDNNPYMIALGLSKGSLMGARGNSGVILSQLCRGFATGIQDYETLDVTALANGFMEAANTAYKAVMKPTEGTILTVARECGEFAISYSRKEQNVVKFLEKVIEHGNKTLDSTQDMLPVLKQAGVVDAGGKGLMHIISGAYNGLLDKDIEAEDIDIIPAEERLMPKKKRAHIDTDDIEYGYCTEFMINAKYDDIDGLREELSKNADSLLVVGGEDVIKVHVHTNNPGLVLDRVLQIGELSDIKIDNMRYQHEEILLKDELLEQKNNNINKKKKATKKYSFVSISMGEGIDKIFKSLNVDGIVSGGQTMNPSTEDILKAIEETEGETVFILPNNKNIILAAEQTVELSDRNVVVIPTKSIPQGIGALLAFNETEDVENNTEAMIEYIQDVYTGQITYAVRDTDVNGKKILKDDIIGLFDGNITNTGKEINKVSLELIEEMINEDISIITIIYGENIKEEDAKKLTKKLEEKYSDLDIDLVYGGQPLYYYIFSLE